jgi:hypothetical protein
VDAATAEKHEVVGSAMRLERPGRMPCGDWAMVEYRPHAYHLGEGEPLPPPGEVGVTRDGRRRVTRDGGVWAVDAKERYKTPEDVLQVDLSRFEVEDVREAMLDEMARRFRDAAEHAFPLPMHYSTLVTRATIEFGWEPMLTAAALDPARFGAILDRFGDASLAVARGWVQVAGTELICVHDDVAATRGPILSPAFLRRYVFPWYARIFDAIHYAGRQVLYITDGNYAPLLDDILALQPDGLYIESSSMEPGEFMRRAGRDKLFLIKTDSRAIDFGTPEDIRCELLRLRDLHREFPGMMIYRGGGNPTPANAEAFERQYRELLVYR